MHNNLEHKQKKKKFDDESWEDVQDKKDKSKKPKRDDFSTQRKSKRGEGL